MISTAELGLSDEKDMPMTPAEREQKNATLLSNAMERVIPRPLRHIAGCTEEMLAPLKGLSTPGGSVKAVGDS